MIRSSILCLTGLALVLALALAGGAARAAGGYGNPIPGRHIYDTTGLLTPREIADLERHALTVQQAGAPVAVYLQARDASYDATARDASDLMARWAIESALGRRDGLVIFLNLKPGDLRHGQLALYAGQRLFTDARALPQHELQRISDVVMRPLLARGQTAQAIAAGLDVAAHDLTYGAPPSLPPGTVQRVSQQAGRWVVNGAAAVVALLAVWAFAASRCGRRIVDGPANLTPPGDLPAALVGALVAGRVGDQQMQGALLALAQRGALAIEPAGARKIQVRLLDSEQAQPGYETSLWGSLTTLATGDLIPAAKVAKLHGAWGGAKTMVRQDLAARGWYDRDAGIRRRPLYAIGGMALALAFAGVVLVAIAQEAWGVPGTVVLGIIGITSLVAGYSVPDTSVAGEAVAASWRGYRNGILAAARGTRPDLDLDAVLPYGVAMGIAGKLGGVLKRASGQGYRPSWFGGATDAGFYPYWMVFMASTAPSSGAGAAAAGAAAGGGGAGGSF